MTSGPRLVSGVSFFLADVLQLFLLPPVWMYMKEAETDPRRADIKHHMTAAVIASETTKHIKTPLPLSHLLLPRSLFPDGIITQFPQRKWKRSESSTFQRADGLPRYDGVMKTRSGVSRSGPTLSPRVPLCLCLRPCRYERASDRS